jgi:uncharacterized membrane protein YidH (DUF202 family)
MPTEKEDPRIDLAIERTEYALERTQLAWIRTTLSFLGSGIALDKGMEFIHQARVQENKALFENAHVIGITLSCAGTLLMILTTWFFIHRQKALTLKKDVATSLFPPAFWASLLVIILGISVSILLIIT